MNIVFMGTGYFSLKALVALYENHYDIISVYTRAPKPFGRNLKVHKSVVHEFAKAKGIKVFTPKSFKSSEQINAFALLKSDLAVVSSYGLIIPQDILDIPKYGFINIHASALPRWRGAAPIQAAILAGDKQTGVTIMKMDAGVDTGDIISMRRLDISMKTTYGQLSEDMGNLGARMIIETLADLETNLMTARKQPEEGVSYAPKISKESSRICWNSPAANILRQIMAFSPIPAAWTEIDGLRVKISDADIALEDIPNTTAGEIFENNGNMLVQTGEGVLKISKIQPAGKNIMSGEEFLRGRRKLVGRVFS